jgi:hypothetical protein
MTSCGNTIPPTGKWSTARPAPWSPSLARPRSNVLSIVTPMGRATSSSMRPSLGNPGCRPPLTDRRGRWEAIAAGTGQQSPKWSRPIVRGTVFSTVSPANLQVQPLQVRQLPLLGGQSPRLLEERGKLQPFVEEGKITLCPHFLHLRPHPDAIGSAGTEALAFSPPYPNVSPPSIVNTWPVM